METYNIYYKVRFYFNNGYRCGCCRKSWDDTFEFLVEQSIEPELLENKKNHNIDSLRQIIYNRGCDQIKRIREYDYGDEFETDRYDIIYTFYSESTEGEIEIEWDTPFDLKREWAQFEEEQDKLRIASRKQRRIAELKAELKELQS